MSPVVLREQLRAEGLALGFARVGFTSAEPFPRAKAALRESLAQGHLAELRYLHDAELRSDPRALLPSARSIISVALAYAAGAERGAVARYARGADYHLVVMSKLAELIARVRALAGKEVELRACVDAAPLCERDIAARAGVGFIGKSGMLIIPGMGSYTVLGELITSLELTPDPPARPRCGSCRLCVEACPTGAISPRGIDARRCLAYLTIEHRGLISPELGALLGGRVFGCDVCQEVCPYNAGRGAVPVAPELLPRPELVAPRLEAWLSMGSGEYRRLVRGSALRRASRNTLARNAAVALGNSQEPHARLALCAAVDTHKSELVKEQARLSLIASAQ